MSAFRSVAVGGLVVALSLMMLERACGRADAPFQSFEEVNAGDAALPPQQVPSSDPFHSHPS
jgi:hypothetical protein